MSFADRWHDFWLGSIGDWILVRGVPIALYLIGGLLAARFINWGAQRIVRRIDAEYQESDQLVRTESAKHRQAVASVISLFVGSGAAGVLNTLASWSALSLSSG